MARLRCSPVDLSDPQHKELVLQPVEHGVVVALGLLVRDLQKALQLRALGRGREITDNLYGGNAMHDLPKQALLLGQALQARYDCSERPLPNEFNVLLCLLDGAERRQRVQARCNGKPMGNMICLPRCNGYRRTRSQR